MLKGMVEGGRQDSETKMQARVDIEVGFECGWSLLKTYVKTDICGCKGWGCRWSNAEVVIKCRGGSLQLKLY